MHRTFDLCWENFEGAAFSTERKHSCTDKRKALRLVLRPTSLLYERPDMKPCTGMGTTLISVSLPEPIEETAGPLYQA